jgi:heme/copper-type cytochrome/quinol oxidase subunit 4
MDINTLGAEYKLSHPKSYIVQYALSIMLTFAGRDS